MKDPGDDGCINMPYLMSHETRTRMQSTMRVLNAGCDLHLAACPTLYKGERDTDIAMQGW